MRILTFTKKVIETDKCYYDDVTPRGPNTYVAPYFCMIQSSGMGKTRLLYEYRNLTRSQDITDDDKTRWYEAKTILSGPIELVAAEKGIFDWTFSVSLSAIQIEAFKFRCIRLWLRQIRTDIRFVAVFTGTSPALENYKIHSDTSITPVSDSRWMQSLPRKFYKKGSRTFSPFTTFTTIGCQLHVCGNEDNNSQTEYEKAVAYGRPLFSIMQANSDLDRKLPKILRRMVLQSEPNDWMKNRLSCLSILGTRVQMGSTSRAVVSDLVAKGYANLVDLTDDAAKFMYPTDAVCARLAAGMMTSEWKLAEYRGQCPTFWTCKAKELYSSGLCRPEKGDFGQVMVALYVLFCADKLRAQADSLLKLQSISVPLGSWASCVIRGGNDEDETVVERTTPKRQKQSSCLEEVTKKANSVRLSCWQFCRNYLRDYGTNWTCFADQSFLGHLYRSGTVFFTFSGCPLMDAVSVLYYVGCQNYAPLFLSIQSTLYGSPHEARNLCSEMANKAKEGKVTKGLCLVVVYGSNAGTSSDGDLTFSQTKCAQVAEGYLVQAVVRIPSNDSFGISDALARLTEDVDVSEVHASHSFVKIAPTSSLTCTEYLGTLSNDRPQAMDALTALSEQLKDSKTRSS